MCPQMPLPQMPLSQMPLSQMPLPQMPQSQMPLPQMPLPQVIIIGRGMIAAIFHSCIVVHGTIAALCKAIMIIGVQHQLIGLDICMTGRNAMKIATEKDACVNPYIIFETELWSDLA